MMSFGQGRIPIAPFGGMDDSFNKNGYLSHHNGLDNSYFLQRNKETLRKGKWTAEEERFANKVIEYFNAGTLKLDDEDRGITLRAYLAQKLGCDPMRITKKYTGASCLGKRVYHAFRQNGKTEEMERTTAELYVLEKEFKAKLMQSGRKRSSSESYTKFSPTAITTPGIDALFGTNPAAGNNWSSPHNSASSSSGYYQQSSHQSQYQTPHMAATEALTGVSSFNGAYMNRMMPMDQNAFTSGGPDGRTTDASDNTEKAFDSTDDNGSSTRDDEGVSSLKRQPHTVMTEHEPHDTEAASSLLGFFNQLERHSSQEDMVHFFEGVQKSVASTRSPPKPTAAPRSMPPSLPPHSTENALSAATVDATADGTAGGTADSAADGVADGGSGRGSSGLAEKGGLNDSGSSRGPTLTTHTTDTADTTDTTHTTQHGESANSDEFEP